MIASYDNIPIVSYALLRGKCRHCGTAIAIRYPLVELMGGLFALCVYLKFGLTLDGLIYYAFISALLVITFIDIDHQIIPDRITLPGIPIFFLAALALPDISLLNSLLGLLLGGGTLLVIGLAYQLITNKEGMGGGDIKLLAMIGVLLGWEGVLFTVFTASAVGTIAGLVAMIQQRKGMKLAIPFGPFLSIGAITYVFFGSKLIYWYFNLLK
jgi:leader peptidase (prepilin peptidase)/N-methyltransferase